MNIVLTGFMGSGKSTVGKTLARELGMEFVDLDGLIEREAGSPIKDIFAVHGEGYFRGLETGVVERLAAGGFGEGLVVSAGGGAVVNDSNRALLRRWATVICLKATVEEIIRRVGETVERPLLNTEERKKTIEKLLEERKPAYSDCDLEIDTTGVPVTEVVKRIKFFLDKKII